MKNRLAQASGISPFKLPLHDPQVRRNLQETPIPPGEFRRNKELMKPKKTTKKTAPRSGPGSGETEFYSRAAKGSPQSGDAPKKTRSADPEKEKPLEVPRKTAARKTALKVPPILLEGDKPPVAKVSGPGQRYA